MLDYLLKQTETVMKAKVTEFPNYIAKTMLARELMATHFYSNYKAWKIATTVEMNVAKEIALDPEFGTLIKNICVIIANVEKQLKIDTELTGAAQFDEVFFGFIKTMQFQGN
jgi:hypothetical protein